MRFGMTFYLRDMEKFKAEDLNWGYFRGSEKRFYLVERPLIIRQSCELARRSFCRCGKMKCGEWCGYTFLGMQVGRDNNPLWKLF